MKRLCCTTSLVVLMLSMCGNAWADPVLPADSAGPAAPAARPVPDSDWSAQGGIGQFVDPDAGMGFTLAGAAMRRTGPIEVGAAIELGTQIFGYSYVGLAGALGVGVRTRSGVRIDVLALGGSHSYTGVGAAFLSDDPGASGTVGFAGGRIFASYPMFRGPHHMTLGIGGSYEKDVTQWHVTYDYVQSGWFGHEDFTDHADHVLGTQRLGLSVNIGGSFDVR